MATIEQLSAALIKADAAGNTADAKALADEIRRLRAAAGQIPGAAPGQVAPARVSALDQPETTAAGVSGALTRAFALPVAGAAGGFAAGGAPGALAGGAAGVLAPVVADPLVAGFNRLFGTNYQAPSDALSDLLTRFGVPVPRSGAEQLTQQVASGVAAGTAIPAQVGRMAQALAQGTRAAPVVRPIAEAVRVSGMGPTGGRTLSERVGAGAVAGGIGAAPVATEPVDVTAGMVGGGLFPPVAKVGGQVVKGLWETTIQPFSNPTMIAQRQMFRAAGGTVGSAERTISEIQAGQQVPMTPGFQPTVPELIVAGGGEAPPTMAVLAERVVGASPQVQRQTYQLMNERVGALQAQLARVNQQIEQQGAMLQPGALDELTQVRDGILRSLDTERAQMEAALRVDLPAGPQESGEAILQRAQSLEDAIKQTEVRPAYRKALEAGGAAKVNIDSVVAEAERVLGRPLSSFDPATAPAIVRRILALRPAAQEPVGQAAPPFRATYVDRPAPVQPPASATLAELDDLRKAINSDITAAARGSSTLAGVETRNLLGLQRTIDAAIDASDTLPQQAKDLYGEAVATYRTLYAPRFREGETARILKPAMFGENRIDPAQIVQQFTKDIDAAQQFLTTFQGDARAFESLRNGILGQFRLAAVDPATGMVDPAKAAGFMQSRAEVLSVLENGGLGLRQTLERFEQEAAQGSEALAKLNTIGGPFRDKTPAQVLDYILGSGERMGVALNRSGPAERDAIRRVVSTRLNQMLTQTPGGQPLTEGDAMRAVGEMLDSTGNLKPAYRQALGPDLAREFADRARGMRLLIQTGKDPMLRNPNAVAPMLRAQNFTPEQLTDIQLVIDDIARANKVAEAARAARASARPTGRDVLEEEAETAPARINKLNLLDRFYTLFRNVYMGATDRINPKIAAQLANMMYNNPDAAIAALKSEVARAQRNARPAGVSRVMPAAYGAGYGKISEVNVPRSEEQEPQ
jgi:hypothetical protein